MGWELRGEEPCLERWKAFILAFSPSGRRPLDIPEDTGGLLALDRTPSGVDEADMGWCGLSGSDTDRKDGILLGASPRISSKSGVGVSGVSGGEPGVGGVSAMFKAGRLLGIWE